jgi:hypothetical protein
VAVRRKYDERGYRAARARFGRLVASGAGVCWRCGGPIRPGGAWHTGHSDDGRAIMGPEHAGCNLRAQNVLRAARARGEVPPAGVVVREW